ncbi:MAG: hypothetical protein AB2L20_13340 [Mangrovibacterium sp.]
MKLLLKLLLVFFPWPLRRRLLVRIFKYKIHPTARIGLSFFYPEHLVMGPEATVGHPLYFTSGNSITRFFRIGCRFGPDQSLYGTF